MKHGAEDPGLYDYVPIIDRPVLTWPGGARVAFWWRRTWNSTSLIRR